MVKCITTGDWHIRDSNIEESKKCLSFLVETARKECPDIIINSGDSYDVGGTRLDSLAAKLVFETVQKLANIAPVTIITGTKSHDSTSIIPLKYISAKYPVWVSDYPEQIYLSEGDLNSDPAKLYAPDQAPIDAVISLVPAPSKKYFQSESGIDATNQEIASAMSAIFAGFGAKAQKYDCPHILSGHFSVSGAFLSENRQMVGYDVEIGKDQIALSGAGLVALSHIHLKQQIGSNIFYSGSLFQMDTSEAGQNFGFWIHEIDPATGLHESEYHITPFTRLLKLTYDLTDPQADFKLPFTLEQLNNVRDAAVKVEIKVYEDEVTKIDREGLERNLSEAKSHDIKIIRCPRENVRSENILKLTTLRDKLTEMARLKNEEVPESILTKADMLESMEGDEIVKNAATCR